MGWPLILYDQPQDITKWYESLVAGHVQLGALKYNLNIHVIQRIPETVSFDLIRNRTADKKKVMEKSFPDCIWIRDNLSSKIVTPIYVSDTDIRFLQSGKRWGNGNVFGGNNQVFVGYAFLHDGDAARFKLTWPEYLSDWKTLG